MGQKWGNGLEIWSRERREDARVVLPGQVRVALRGERRDVPEQLSDLAQDPRIVSESRGAGRRRLLGGSAIDLRKAS